MESEVFERIRDYLADQLDIEAEKITTLSDEFGVEIPDEEIENFHTVGDVVAYVEEHMQ